MIKRYIWKENYPRPKDPLSRLYVEVGLVLFLMISVLAMSFVYLKSEPSNEATSFVIYEYPEINADFIGNFVSDVKNSEDRLYIKLTMYTLWIVIIGLFGMVVTERKRK
ncbi:MAG: hypothetical protein QXK37_01060 [Candidatus Woesearchaeota archaeon]